MKKLTFIVLFSLLIIGGVFSQPLVSVNEAVKLLKSKDVVLVSARKSSDYAKVHIKGAVNVDLSTLETESGKIKNVETLAKILGSKGISCNKKIIVYCKTGVNAGRLYWILNYLGCNNVSMLDGHMKAWREARKPVTRTKPQIKPVKFVPSVNKSIIADKNYVKSKIGNPNTVIIDARNKEDFDAGHIKGAKSLPHKKLLSDTKLKSKSSLQSIFNSIGATPNKEIILYCKTGRRAGLLYFVLKEILGYKNVKVYDGGYKDWKN